MRKNSIIIALLIALAISSQIRASELVHKFGNPSFSGVGQSAHYLTIDEQERTRKAELAKKAQDALEDAEREAENTVLAKFIRNLESRIYAQLSRQLVDNLFGETPQTSGVIELLGNKIEYTSDGEFITLKITDADGNTTEITVPIGSFTF